MKPIDRSPARNTSLAAASLGVAVLIAVGPYSVLTLGLCGLGVGLLSVGLSAGSRRAVTGGACGLFFGAVATATVGVPTPLVVFGIIASVVAWDLGQTAIGLGEQLGQEAETERLELLTIATSAAVGTVTGAVGYIVYLVGTGGQPLSALLVFLLAIVVLFAALRLQPVPDQ